MSFFGSTQSQKYLLRALRLNCGSQRDQRGCSCGRHSPILLLSPQIAYTNCTTFLSLAQSSFSHDLHLGVFPRPGVFISLRSLHNSVIQPRIISNRVSIIASYSTEQNAKQISGLQGTDNSKGCRITCMFFYYIVVVVTELLGGIFKRYIIDLKKLEWISSTLTVAKDEEKIKSLYSLKCIHSFIPKGICVHNDVRLKAHDYDYIFSPFILHVKFLNNISPIFLLPDKQFKYASRWCTSANILSKRKILTGANFYLFV